MNQIKIKLNLRSHLTRYKLNEHKMTMNSEAFRLSIGNIFSYTVYIILFE